jgi:hypothetical protein
MEQDKSREKKQRSKWFYMALGALAVALVA